MSGLEQKSLVSEILSFMVHMSDIHNLQFQSREGSDVAVDTLFQADFFFPVIAACADVLEKQWGVSESMLLFTIDSEAPSSTGLSIKMREFDTAQNRDLARMTTYLFLNQAITTIADNVRVDKRRDGKRIYLVEDIVSYLDGQPR